MRPPPVKRFLHDVSHRSVSFRGRLGAGPGILQAERRGSSGAQRRVQAPVRFGLPACAGPVTMVPDSGLCDVPGGRDPSGWTVPRSAANHAAGRSHALPGVPGGPSGRPGVQVSGVQVSPSRALDRTAPSGTSPVVANRTGANVLTGCGGQGRVATLRLRVPPPQTDGNAWDGSHWLRIVATGEHQHFQLRLPEGTWVNWPSSGTVDDAGLAPGQHLIAVRVRTDKDIGYGGGVR